MRKDIILASISERRSAILTSCGMRHIVVSSNVKEAIDSGKPVYETVKNNAVAKAKAVAKDAYRAVVIGADTLVAHGDIILGKPRGEDEAKNMLSSFSGRTIEVYTGMCVIDTTTKKMASGVDRSEITVTRLSEEEIQKYFPLLGPYDKAGGFSIEGVGSMIFDNIKGSYFNILGLSMVKLKDLFQEAGLNMLDFIENSPSQI